MNVTRRRVNSPRNLPANQQTTCLAENAAHADCSFGRTRGTQDSYNNVTWAVIWGDKSDLAIWGLFSHQLPGSMSVARRTSESRESKLSSGFHTL